MYKKHGKKVNIMIFQGEQLFGGGNLICCHIIIKDKVTNYHVVQKGIIRKVLHSQRQCKIKINVQRKQLCMEKIEFGIIQEPLMFHLHGINKSRYR